MTEENLVGKTIGNYSVTGLLGRGGMGAVYLARNTRIDLEVAIKVLRDRVAAAGSISERFQAEAAAIARLSHPNVIRIFDFGVTDGGRLYYVMEKLQGRELGKILADRERLTAGEVLPYLEQICAALQAAHDHGVIHRDLKPENIFITDDPAGQVKVLDFGIAKLTGAQEHGLGHNLTHTGMIMGTPLYIAPEQAAGRPDQICPQTDLYSLGVILYYLLSGHTPFTAESTAQLLTKHISVPAPPLSSEAPRVPAPVAKLVERCLEKMPENRPISAMALAASFKAAVSGQDATSTDPPSQPEARSDAGSDIGLAQTAQAMATTEQGPRLVFEEPPANTTMQGATGQVVDELADNASLGTPSRHPGRGVMIWAGVLGVATLITVVALLSRDAPVDEPGPGAGAATLPPLVASAPEQGPPPAPAIDAGARDQWLPPAKAAPATRPAAKKTEARLRRVSSPKTPKGSPASSSTPPSPAVEPAALQPALPDASPPAPPPAKVSPPPPGKPASATPAAKTKQPAEDPPPATPPTKRRWVIDPFATQGDQK